MLFTFLMNLNQIKLFVMDKWAHTRTCIVYHKLHHVFQNEYITKLITHFHVQFNYVKLMKYHYL